MEANNSNSRLIYSTDFGSACPDCGKPKNNCICRKMKKTTAPETSGAVRLRYESVGRKGKGVTLITGLPLSEENLLELSKKLKQQLATGGTVKDFAIELQGDFREKAAQALRKSGYAA
jgi:translation initiation factor 1